MLRRGHRLPRRSQADIEYLRAAGRLASSTLEFIEPFVKPGVSTLGSIVCVLSMSPSVELIQALWIPRTSFGPQSAAGLLGRWVSRLGLYKLE